MKSATLLLLIGATLLAACGDVQPIGVDEPIYMNGGRLRREALPGFPPDTTDATGPRVVAIDVLNTEFNPGQRARSFGGTVTDDAWAIGVQLVGYGDTWWSRPVLGRDPFVVGQLVYSFNLDFGEIEPGRHTLRFVAVDEQGRGGRQVDLPICIRSPVPDNRNACDATQRPPATIVSLRFSAEANVDLALAGPDGEIVDARRPTGAGPGPVTAEDLANPVVPRFGRNALANCVSDGLLRETVVFEEDPSSGSWDVFVNLFDACGEPAVTYVVEIYRRVDHGDGTYSLELTDEYPGQLLDLAANGGTELGTYLTTLTFP